MTRILLTGGQVFDGTGAPPARADVLVKDGRIIDVGTGLDGDVVVDCTGCCLLPGLIDCHVHLLTNRFDPVAHLSEPFSLKFFKAVENMRATLATGITTVRDAVGADLGVKVAQELGIVAGPRVQIAISQLSQTGGHHDYWEVSGCCTTGMFTPHPGMPASVVDGPDAVRSKVRELVRAGADVIKVATSGGVFSPRADPRIGHFRDAEVAVMVEEATAAGISVMAHANAAEGVKVAVRNGVRSIEHGAFLDDEAIDMMLSAGTWLVPTLMAARGVQDQAEKGVEVPEHMLEKDRMVADAHLDSARRAIAAGVRIAFGTDTGVTAHGDNLDELPLLVECGMTPAEALRSAMLPAARLLGLDDELGSLEPGKRADLVMVDGDPLDFADFAGRIRRVYQDGVLVHAATS